MTKPAPISDEMAAKVAAALAAAPPPDTIEDGPDGPVMTYTDGTSKTVPVPK